MAQCVTATATKPVDMRTYVMEIKTDYKLPFDLYTHVLTFAHKINKCKIKNSNLNMF